MIEFQPFGFVNCHDVDFSITLSGIGKEFIELLSQNNIKKLEKRGMKIHNFNKHNFRKTR